MHGSMNIKFILPINQSLLDSWLLTRKPRKSSRSWVQNILEPRPVTVAPNTCRSSIWLLFRSPFFGVLNLKVASTILDNLCTPKLGFNSCGLWQQNTKRQHPQYKPSIRHDYITSIVHLRSSQPLFPQSMLVIYCVLDMCLTAFQKKPCNPKNVVNSGLCVFLTLRSIPKIGKHLLSVIYGF
jgi:hypothetical protein